MKIEVETKFNPGDWVWTEGKLVSKPRKCKHCGAVEHEYRHTAVKAYIKGISVWEHSDADASGWHYELLDSKGCFVKDGNDDDCFATKEECLKNIKS